MDKITEEIFDVDPTDGCPFDRSGMVLVEKCEDEMFRVADRVKFFGSKVDGSTEQPVVTGKVVAIGENAKSFEGVFFTAVAVRVGESILVKAKHQLF